MPKLMVGLLGGLAVSINGEAVSHFESVKVRALLAYLAAEAGRPQMRSSLAGLLWPDWPEEAASKNLRHTLYSLRKALADPTCLEADRQGVTLIPGEDCRVDVIELEKSLGAALADRQSREVVARLEQVVEQIGGGFLDGFTLDDSPVYEEWVLGRRAHHNQQALEALGLLADWHEQASAYYRAEIFARRELEIEAWREEAYRQLMRVLALQGKRSQALAQYEACKKILQDGLATQPGEETTWLYEQIRRGLFPPEQSRDARVPVSLPAEAPHNLPQPLTHFIGRVETIARLKAWLAEHRLVTIAGPGGVGKTRLAMRVAEGVVGRYEYGVYFIDLAVVREPDMMVPAVIKSLGIYTEGSRSLLETLLSFLETRHVLLVMDNCEHLIHAVTELIGRILRQCAQVWVMATSREILSLDGEKVFQLMPLAFLDLQAPVDYQVLREMEAAQLFEDRARAVQPGFTINDKNASTVAGICKQLDGIPLALELAAVRLRVLSLEQIETLLANRLKLLTSGWRGALPRQQTLQASIEWSFDLLSEAEKIIYRRLSVFSGGCSLEGAQRICARDDLDAFQVIDLLDSLAGKSLLVVTQDDPPRYRMLETIREYAHDKLQEAGEVTECLDCHLEYFYGLAEVFDRKINSNEGGVFLYHKLDPEIPNLRLAIHWALNSEDCKRIDKAVRILDNLHGFWHDRDMLPETATLGLKALEMLPKENPDYAIARARAILYSLGLMEEDRKYMDLLLECQDIFQKHGDIYWLAKTKNEMAHYLVRLGKEHHPRAAALARESVTEMRTTGDLARLAEILLSASLNIFFIEGIESSASLFEEGYALSLNPGNWLAHSYTRVGRAWEAENKKDYATAKRLYEEMLENCKEINCRHGIAECTGMVGVADYYLGNFAQMEAAFREGLRLGEELGMTTSIRFTRRNLGIALLRQGKYDQAWDLLLKNINLVPNDTIGNIPLSLVYIGGICLETGLHEQAAQIFGCAAPRVEERLKMFMLWDQQEIGRVFTQAQACRDDPAFASLWEEGHQMTLEQIIALVNRIQFHSAS